MDKLFKASPALSLIPGLAPDALVTVYPPTYTAPVFAATATTEHAAEANDGSWVLDVEVTAVIVVTPFIGACIA